MRGVESALPAYTGGSDPNPTYNAVCSGNTGHAETVEVVFDQTIISFETILEVFFTLHDPTQLNRQGNDIGTQYRSAIFYCDEGQRMVAESVKESISEYFDNDIITEITPLNNHHIAEVYHHDYFGQNPNNRYCQMVVAPKLAAIRQKHATLY